MWSAEPVARMTSLWGLKAMQLTSAVCTSENAAGPVPCRRPNFKPRPHDS